MKKYQLPKELAEKWIVALESGEYKQGIEYLFLERNGEDTYCCLGVLGCVLNARRDYMLGFSEHKIGNIIDGLPDVLNYKYESGSGELIEKLVGINDSGNYDFHQIANWIKENCEFI